MIVWKCKIKSKIQKVVLIRKKTNVWIATGNLLSGIKYQINKILENSKCRSFYVFVILEYKWRGIKLVYYTV